MKIEVNIMGTLRRDSEWKGSVKETFRFLVVLIFICADYTETFNFEKQFDQYIYYISNFVYTYFTSTVS